MGTMNLATTWLPPLETLRRLYKIGIIVSLLTTSTHAAAAAPKQIQHELVLARNYGLAACIIARYPGTALAHEADEWAIGLVEDGNLPGEAYPALAEFVKKAPNPKRTKNGVILHLQSCVDFVNSDMFAQQVKKWIKH